MSFPDPNENEILTDSAAVYLGIGWPALECCGTSVEMTSSGTVRVSEHRLGYLTPQEYGYLIAKRAVRFGESPERWLRNPDSVDAFRQGMGIVAYDSRVPPHANSGELQRMLYMWRQRKAIRHVSRIATAQYCRNYGMYGFELAQKLAVVFSCPTCFQKLRVPLAERTVTVRCPVCHASSDCRP